MALNTFVKVILNNGDTSDARYIDMMTQHFSVFELRQRIISIFQIPPEVEFKLTYVDQDGDHITILTDSDLYIASAQMQERRVFHVTYASKPQVAFDEPPVGNHVICDVCEKPLTGYRYKCLECIDYDLCTACESAGHHSEHIFLRLPNSDMPMTRSDRKLLYNAARELKKAAHAAHKKSHRFAKEFCKSQRREAKCEKGAKPQSYSCPGTSAGCPFTEQLNPEDFSKLGNIARQHLAPFLQSAPQGNIISDVIRNAVEAVFGPVSATQSDPEASNVNNTQTTPKNAEGAKTQTESETVNQSSNSSTTYTSATNINENNKGQNGSDNNEKEKEKDKTATIDLSDMDWTMVNNNQVPATPVNTPSAPVSTSQTAPPPGFLLHPDPVIALGLAQLYEMGFSNEDGILTNLLIRYNGNVSEVVKTIVNMK